ncbi:MAG: type 4a pilus biogenesis protein PilO [Methylotenera sp.]|uniref:type 4a pilus biogenesis protein PilO n=1 Tax=Methylotenera sp. TaxID=2051956 RepID=UPI0018596078|nr:type 4a pilus biogenesis protein PilO [Methylotenera sp.]NOU26022.1 type 4a pilus biogenesis protein PilO [Methylotenera sp.]
MLVKLSAYLKYQYERLSKLTLAGLILIICAMILLTFSLTYQQNKLEKLKVDMADMQRGDEMKANRSTDTVSQLELYENLILPNKSELPNVIEYIHTVAKKNNIYFDNVEYKFSDLTLIQSQSYEVTFPASGNYLNVRKFIQEVSRLDHGIVLKNIELSRDNNQINEIDALFEFSIYLKNEQ